MRLHPFDRIGTKQRPQLVRCGRRLAEPGWKVGRVEDDRHAVVDRAQSAVFGKIAPSPRTITLDGYAASRRAVREMKADGQLPTDKTLRLSKYLNNLIEQDHRGVKLRIAPMLGFKWMRTAAVTVADIELLRRIHKGQFKLGKLRLKDRTAPAIWNAVLAAR